MIDERLVNPETGQKCNFTLAEFKDNMTDQAMIHPWNIVCLERLRSRLEAELKTKIRITITSGLRSEAKNRKLAETLGWTDAGGKVSRNSKHLPKYYGVAQDIMPKQFKNGSYRSVPKKVILPILEELFDFVKGPYPHYHVDNRNLIFDLRKKV